MNFILITLIFIVVPYAIADNWDPYDVMNIDRGATLDQIKSSYRDLARKLHPDKSNLKEDEAEKKFIELNKAYNILKDPAKRLRYDQSGDTRETDQHSRRQNHKNRYGREFQYQWTQYDSDGFRTFTFHTSPDGYLRKKSISTRQYYNEFMRESRTKPFLIFFYSNFCQSCLKIEKDWEKIVEKLAKYNIGSFNINVNQEHRLSQDLDVNHIPRIACLLDGHVYYYDRKELVLDSMVKFIKSLLPNNLFPLLRNEEEQDRYIVLGPQESNKLSAIIIHNQDENIRLRYLLLAYELKSLYRFAQIPTKLCKYETLAKKYSLKIGANLNQSYLLVFDEDVKKTYIETKIELRSSDMNLLRDQLLRWPYLKLPKLSSQHIFDDLCVYVIPKEGFKTAAKLCVILFLKDQPSSQTMKNKLLEFIEFNNLVRDNKVVFSYIDTNKQQEFVDSLLIESIATYPFSSSTDETVNSAIIILERNQQNNRKSLYKWLSHRWNVDSADELDKAKIELYDFIASYKIDSSAIRNRIVLKLLVDENGPNLFERIYLRLFDYISRIFNFLTTRDSISTFVILISCVLITHLLVSQFSSSTGPSNRRLPFDPSDDFLRKPANKPSENNLNNNCCNNQTTQNPSSTNNNHESSLSKNDLEFKIIELKLETYNGMVRLLKPGFRSIILICDGESREKLLIEFKKACWPYRRNKTLLFGYLCLDKNLQWYKSLLEQVLDVEELNVNKRKCIGTVLSLNGFKKYFRVYHAKHHEIDYYDNETNVDGSFLGFNDDDDEDDVRKSIEDGSYSNRNKEMIYTPDNLLDRLPIWLDKMFDGLTKRYCIENWPEDII